MSLLKKSKLFAVRNERRRFLVRNAFCPTGPGGGQDNSCSPWKAGGGFSKVMFRGVGAGSDSISGFEWYSETPDLAKKYADFRGGEVVQFKIEVKNMFKVDNPHSVLDSTSFFAKASTQFFAKASKQTQSENRSNILEKRKAFIAHFGSKSRLIMDFWSSEKSKEVTRDLLESFGFDSIKMVEAGEETIGVFRSSRQKPTANTSKISKVGRNLLKVDPSRTLTLRRIFQDAIKRRLAFLKKKIVQLIVVEDAFGLRESSHDPFSVDKGRFFDTGVENAFCPTGEGGGQDNSCPPWKTDGSQSVRSFEEVTKDIGALIAEKGFDERPDIDKKIAELRIEQSKARELKEQAALELAAKTTNTPEFKRWFGDSKVVDSSGRPKEVYHGTSKKFDEFKPNYLGLIFFSEDIEPTYRFSKGAVTVAAYLKMEKPFNPTKPEHIKEVMKEFSPQRIQEGREFWENFYIQNPSGGYVTVANYPPDFKKMAKGGWQAAEHPEVIAAIKSVGFDGLVLSEEDEDGELFTSYAVFSSQQVKSSKSNKGKFDPNDPVIHNTRWKFQTNAQKIEAFRKWLALQTQYILVGSTTEEIEQAFWHQYVQEGYEKGLARAYDDVKKSALKTGQRERDFYEGSKTEFLRAQIYSPVSVDKVKLLAGRTYTDLKGVTDYLATILTRTLTDGLVQGKSPREVAVDITAQIDSIGKNRALTIARTECLPGDTRVSSAVVRAVFRRWYDGPMVEVETSSGRKFSATPNHPMLTKEGWVNTGLIKPGDYLVCDRREQNPIRHPNVETSPLTISEIFDSINAVRVVERVSTLAVDFHGDGRQNSYVDILRPDGELEFGSFSPLYKPFVQNVFSPSGFSSSTFCYFCGRLLSVNKQTCLCSSSCLNSVLSEKTDDNPSVCVEGSSNRISGFSSKISGTDLVEIGDEVSSELVRNSTLFPSEMLDVGSAPVDFKFSQVVPNCVDMNIRDSGDLVPVKAGQIELDHVLNVRIRQFSGHVYNLETPYGYYNIFGLYTGNTIRAHAEGQLDAMESLGVTMVGVAVEWRTAKDDKVCDACAELDGVVLKIEEAHNLLPRHPNCRCAFLPANLGEKEDNQIRSKSAIEKAFGRSIMAETGIKELEEALESSDWMGVDADISKNRPENLDLGEEEEVANQWKEMPIIAGNVFCPTGPGGGVDPTCSPGEASDSKLDSLKPDYSKIADKKERQKLMQAVADYIEVGFEDVNTSLRSGDDLDWASGPNQIWIRSVTRAFEKAGHTLDQDLTVYRAVSKLLVPEQGKFTDRGFLSTTASKEYAEAIAKQKGGDAVVIKMRIPKGTSVMAPIGKVGVKEIVVKRGSPVFIEGFTANAFCPTGEGGGQDNSCSRYEGSGGKLEVDLSAPDSKDISDWSDDRDERKGSAQEAIDSIEEGAVPLSLRESGKLVGVAALLVHRESSDPKVSSWWRNVVSVEMMATKQKGLGRQLMRQIAKYASERGLGVSLSSAASARGFYEKLGMHDMEVDKTSKHRSTTFHLSAEETTKLGNSK